ncbi:GNAT family N-acetyltransferase [Floricoccus penangensis]|uniref:GNAT family N-acetyltransferase n=1 Tax=Floricoccus penangensis TaxID=1859475 RepID=A0A9Q5JEH9_9LACT|nr:N-acetyltransferase [Floricoccus penangensis]OFI45758.1 GNAT family N-acetyltransferase [Floricoccus penangensis]
MIRKFEENDLTDIMKLWLDTNISAHDFIPEDYWKNNFEMVKEILPQAEVYVFEEETDGVIVGFVGLTDNYIAGIFVRNDYQAKGIGSQLLDYIKEIKPSLKLSVYEKNTSAIDFYKKAGFVIESENIDEDNNEKEFTMSWDM